MQSLRVTLHALRVTRTCDSTPAPRPLHSSRQPLPLLPDASSLAARSCTNERSKTRNWRDEGGVVGGVQGIARYEVRDSDNVSHGAGERASGKSMKSEKSRVRRGV
jgi:hypothetical protein